VYFGPSQTLLLLLLLVALILRAAAGYGYAERS